MINEDGPSQYVLIYDMKDFSFTKNMDVEAIRKVRLPHHIKKKRKGKEKEIEISSHVGDAHAAINSFRSCRTCTPNCSVPRTSSTRRGSSAP